ncbi:MAG: gp16 family protein [Pseudomonadota bacterium]
MKMTSGARQFARHTVARRPLLAKVHLAAKELGLSDDDYRAILIDVAGVSSARDMSETQLAAVIERFKARGWKQAAPRGRGQGKPADHPAALKARALWISLYHLGAIDNASEAALEAFARRQLKCARLQWADQALVYRLVEALKAIAERHGWSQSVEGLQPAAVPIVLRRRLVEAILGKLWANGAAPASWDVVRAAWEFGGYDGELLVATASELDGIAREFGRVLRETGGARK